MSMGLLDVLRSTGITIMLLSVVVIGAASSLFPAKFKKVKTLIVAAAGILGGLSGLGLFYLFNFIPSWHEYLDAQTIEHTADYSGRHQMAATLIKTLGESGSSTIGVVFGILGIGLLIAGVVNIKSAIKTG